MENLIDLFELFKIFVISVVQGVSEWLPISSTGHMIILDKVMKVNLDASFMNMFFVLVQLGSILAVVVLYFNKLNPFSPKKTSQERKDSWFLWFKVAVASIPMGVIGLILGDIVDNYLFNWKIVAVSLVVYGFAFIWIENRKQDPRARVITQLEDITFKDAFMIGCYQVLAIIPGTSRSGATILGGLLTGATRFIATEFTFFMGIPAMVGASLFQLKKFGLDFSVGEFIYLASGMIVAFIVSILAIRYLIDYLKNHDFKVFGYYRIVLGIVVIFFFTFFH